jgi:hypothetical protein
MAQNATSKIAQLANTARTRLTETLNSDAAKKALETATASARSAAGAASQRAQNLPGRFGGKYLNVLCRDLPSHIPFDCLFTNIN